MHTAVEGSRERLPRLPKHYSIPGTAFLVKTEVSNRSVLNKKPDRTFESTAGLLSAVTLIAAASLTLERVANLGCRPDSTSDNVRCSGGCRIEIEGAPATDGPDWVSSEPPEFAMLTTPQ